MKNEETLKIMSDTKIPEELLQLRESIDNFDAALVHILAERFRCTKAVGVLKAKYGLPPADPSREKRQVERLRKLAEESHLDPDFAEKFLNFIVKEVIRHHEATALKLNSK
ncbi:chorismate mutase [Bartonella apihabitans]|uniref:chorismate mutase n=2 Tax=Bartonella apihabitans TaxID=2750929 RepID=A0A1U9MDN8_9HYPH|nr:chorismate mutase [Bartonella apihabitans]